jgi:hypothetical protein
MKAKQNRPVHFRKKGERSPMEFKKYTRTDELLDIINITTYGFTLTILMWFSLEYYVGKKFGVVSLEEIILITYIIFLSFLGFSSLFIYFSNWYFQSKFKREVLDNTDYLTWAEWPAFEDYYEPSVKSTNFERRV